MECNPLAVSHSDVDCTRGLPETDHAAAVPIMERHEQLAELDDADLFLSPLAGIVRLPPPVLDRPLHLNIPDVDLYEVASYLQIDDTPRRIRSERGYRFHKECALIHPVRTAFLLLQLFLYRNKFHDLLRQVPMPNRDYNAWNPPGNDSMSHFGHRPIDMLSKLVFLLWLLQVLLG